MSLRAGAFEALTEVRRNGRVRRTTTGPPMNARFRAGSITKSFVATVVLQLAGEGKIGLDDRVRPGITLRQLLQHTSGIPDYGARYQELCGTTEAIVGLRHRTWTTAGLLALIADEPPLFEPGTSWSYSNTNYLLLGELIEQLTGSSYAAEVSRRILGPLGLNDTELPGADPHIAGPHLHGFLRDGVDITVFNHSFAGPAGSLVSTVADLNRFYRALMTGQLLARAELAGMRTTGGSGYGLGLALRHLPDGTPLWGHAGGTFGYETFAWTTEDGTRQATIATTPRPGTDPDPAAFLTAALS